MDSQFLLFAVVLFYKATANSEPSSSGKAGDQFPARRWSQPSSTDKCIALFYVFLLKDTIFSVFIGD